MSHTPTDELLKRGADAIAHDPKALKWLGWQNSDVVRRQIAHVVLEACMRSQLIVSRRRFDEQAADLASCRQDLADIKRWLHKTQMDNATR